MKRALVLFVALLFIAGTAQASPRVVARQLINEQRSLHGCDNRLQGTGPAKVKSARRHSREMADAGEIFHSVLHIGHWSEVGEVVGVAPRWATVIDLFFESRPHRHILLDCDFDKIAVGIVFDHGAWVTGRVYAE